MRPLYSEITGNTTGTSAHTASPMPSDGGNPLAGKYDPESIARS